MEQRTSEAPHRAYDAALCTFARVEGIEPTDNEAERALRNAVLWPND